MDGNERVQDGVMVGREAMDGEDDRKWERICGFGRPWLRRMSDRSDTRMGLGEHAGCRARLDGATAKDKGRTD